MSEMMPDGYPTDDVLTRIREWPTNDLNGCLDFVHDLWHYGGPWCSTDISNVESELLHARPIDRYLRCATGGWSGNEEIVAAMDGNAMLRVMCWRLSAAGGLHIWRYLPADINKEKGDE